VGGRGLAVVGLVHPERVTTNAGARPGDKLFLTKPIGSGILATARRKDAIGEDDFQVALDTMLLLNREAAEAMVAAGAKGATDVTGFGLLGHAQEMAAASAVAVAIDVERVPLLPKTMPCAKDGHVPGGARSNRKHFGCEVEGETSEEWWSILFDPQTSGGLLAALPSGVDAFSGAIEIGEVLAGPPGKIILRQ